MARRLLTGVAIAILCVISLQCGGNSSSTTPTAPTTTTPTPGPVTPTPTPTPTPIPSGPAILVGAGDIAQCGGGVTPAEQTARIVDAIGGQVFTAGDNAYFAASRDDFQNCYEPTWGRFKSRTRPVPGNHEYETDPSASAYFEYFGFSATPSGTSYYSYDVGDWHIVALDSWLSSAASSAQGRWLSADLAAHKTKCTAAIFHYPLFTSGPNGSQTQMRDAWRILYDAGVDLIINGHDHLYERFALQDPDGRRDTTRGIRQFTVGTGGASLYAIASRQANSEMIITNHGVLKLTLNTSGYDWQFIPVSGAGDSGSGVCH
jgi:hypothetical protein